MTKVPAPCTRLISPSTAGAVPALHGWRYDWLELGGELVLRRQHRARRRQAAVHTVEDLAAQDIARPPGGIGPGAGIFPGRRTGRKSFGGMLLGGGS